jgi:F-type H+-transporting ATPase subunit epsilon
MAFSTAPTFRCIVLTPKAKLVDCKTHSVILPAHDGQVGILRNHMPMLVELGLGIMEIKASSEEESEAPCIDRMLLVDGGFASVSQNILTIMAYDVLDPKEIDPAKAQALLEKAQQEDSRTLAQRSRDIRKANLMLQLAQSQPAAS